MNVRYKPLPLALLVFISSCSSEAWKGDPTTGAPGLIYGFTGGLVRTKDNRLAADTVRQKMREDADANKDGKLDHAERAAYTESAAEFDAIETKSQAATLVGLAGGVAGGLAGSRSGLGTMAGVTMGAGAGAAVGNAYGSKVAAKKKGFAMTEAELDSSIEVAEEMHEASAEFNERLEARISALNAQNRRIRAQASTVAERNAQIRSWQDEVRKTLKSSDEQIARLNREIQSQTTAIDAVNLSDNTDYLESLQEGVVSLQEDKKDLQALRLQASTLAKP